MIIDNIIEFLKGFEIQTIAAMGLMLWYFSKGLGAKIDNLDEDVREMNSRVSRLEGTVYGRDLYKEKK